MKTKLKALVAAVLLCWCGRAAADEIVRLTVTVTNAAGIPTNGTATLTINGDTRTATNIVSSSPAKLWLGTNVMLKAATNLYLHAQIYSFGSGASLLSARMTATNAMEFTAQPNQAISASLAGAWGTLTLSTNTATNQIPVVAPAGAVSLATRTNIGAALVDYLSVASNSLGTGLVSMARFVDVSTGQSLSNKSLSHTVASGGRWTAITNLTGTNVALTNVTLRLATLSGADISGVIGALTNGTLVGSVADGVRITNAIGIHGAVNSLNGGRWTNAILDRPTTTNLVNRGAAISSPNTNGMAGENFGLDAVATGINSTAVGRTSTSSGVQSAAFGYAAGATNSSSTAVGNGAIAGGGSSVALGTSASATGANSTALGASASAPFDNSTAIGTTVATTTNNQVRIGTSGHTVSIPGQLWVEGSVTNATLRGTNTLNGRLDLTPRDNASLANGYNSGVVLGTNVYIRMSGPTAAYTNVGFSAAAAVDGTLHVVQANNPGLSFTILNESGLDATAANRILTGTGALKTSTNNPVIFKVIYDGAATRWRLFDWPPN